MLLITVKNSKDFIEKINGKSRQNVLLPKLLMQNANLSAIFIPVLTSLRQLKGNGFSKIARKEEI